MDNGAHTCDEDLVKAAANGSISAFEALVSRYEARVFGFVSRYCHDRGDAAEVTQDTFVSAYQKLSQFRMGHTFASWLFAIARNRCVDRYRTNQRAPRTEELHEHLCESGTPARGLETEEDLAELWAVAKRALTPAQFEALWLRYAEDLSVEEMARVLKITQTHAKVLLFRARRALLRFYKRQQTETGPASVIPFQRLGGLV